MIRHRVALRIALIGLALSTVGCDRVTKHLAVTTLAGNPGHVHGGDLLWIGYTENTGAFLSLGAGLPETVRTALFTWGTGVLLVGLAIVAIRARVWPAVGITLFVAGGLSNWFDRATAGYVVDFLNVGIGSLRTGIFNVADVAIMAGAGVFLLSEFGGKTGDRRAPPLPDSAKRDAP